MTDVESPSSSSKYNDYPLMNIPQPHPHDVLCGRGGGTNNHIGNSHWRMLVAANKQLYITLPKRQKMLLSRSIVNAVRSQKPPGRFLQKDSKSNQWYDVGDQRAQEKTSQALREGAPDIRKKVEAEKLQSEGGTNTNENDDDEDEQVQPTNKTTTTTIKQEQQQQQIHSSTTTTPVQPVQQQQQHPYGTMPYPYPAYPPPPQHPYGYGGHGYPPPPHYGMVPNEQGMMVPAPMPPQGWNTTPPPNAYWQQPQQQPQQGTTTSNTTTTTTTILHQPNDDYYEPLPHTSNGSSSNNTNNNNNNNDKGGKIPTFDEMFAPPPEHFAPSMSYGSIMVTDAEQRKLEAGGHSFGQQQQQQEQEHPNSKQQQQQQRGMVEPMPEAPSGLYQPGSFGDFSMMSLDNNKKLEDAGFSIGSIMSYMNMPDGGLEAIGTSFGSLSLDVPNNKEDLYKTLEITGQPMTEIPEMMGKPSKKSTGDLLDCSDSESEEDEGKIIARKSAAWDKMKASVSANLESQKSKGGTTSGGTGGTGNSSVGSNELMPPPPLPNRSSTGQTGTILSVPATSLERDISQMSGFGDDD